MEAEIQKLLAVQGVIQEITPEKLKAMESALEEAKKTPSPEQEAELKTLRKLCKFYSKKLG